MLKLENISLEIDKVKILSNISFEIEKGEYFVIVGPTGSGKTMLLETIAGLRKHTGKIFFKGCDITNYETEKRKFSIVYQDFALFPHMTVYENIGFSMKVKKIDKKIIKEKVNWISEKLGITNLLHRSIQGLSGGEKQKTAIARSILSSPEILLFDEPLSSIDTSFKKKLYDFFKFIHTEFNLTIIHITHNFDEAINLSDRIGVINEGKIEQIGRRYEIFMSPKTKFIAEFVGADNIIPIITKDNELFLSGISIPLSIKCIDKKFAILHSEDIIISKSKLESSARFSFPGKLTGIISNIYYSELKIDCGLLLNSKITNASINELDLKVNDNIFITFKESALVFI